MSQNLNQTAAHEDFKKDLSRSMEQELTGNILPFWMDRTPDPVNGGFYGALTDDLTVHNEVPRSAVLYARILWTFSAAFRKYGKEEYLETARRAYRYLNRYFWDSEYGGVYWMVDYQGKAVNERKHSYAQAFMVYGLAEYSLASREPESLQQAVKLFNLLEEHAHDPVYGGYVEGCGRDWGALSDMRLSSLEPNCRKSMNTMLHMMEAYANLLRAWDDDRLRSRLGEMVEIFLEHIIDPQTNHFLLFFEDDWRPQESRFSYGHDIEGSWLLVEACQVLKDKDLLDRVRSRSVAMAQAVYEQGLDEDGSLFYEGSPQGPEDTDKHWWVQAEAVVGFYNAYQLSGQEQYAKESERVWRYIQNKFVDRTYGDWYKVLNRAGIPYPSRWKAGPWECPYHHSRACLEMINRLAE